MCGECLIMVLAYDDMCMGECLIMGLAYDDMSGSA